MPLPPSPQTELLLREIATEMAELEREFALKMEGLRRKLRIASGDIKPRNSVVRFELPNGKSFEV
jgi:hypothetical protein